MPEVKLSEIAALTPISSASKLYGITGTAYGYVTIDDIHQLLPEHALLTGLPSTLIGYNDAGVATAIALSAELSITVLNKLEIADNAVGLDKQAHGTANRLQGFDGGGAPSEITVSSLLTLSSGELTVADNAVSLDKQAHGTANRLQGFDGTGAPSEITVSSLLTLSSGELTVADNAVSLDKQAHGTANRLQGFDGTGAPSEITVSSLLTLSSGELTVADNAVSLDKQAHGTANRLQGFDGTGAPSEITVSSLLTLSSGELTVADNAVSLDKQAHGTANRLQGFDGTGAPSEITVSSPLTLSGGELTVADNAVSLDKQAHGTANRLQGFDGTGAPSEITVSSPLTLSGGALSVSGSETEWQKLAGYHRFHLRATAFSTGSTGTGTTGSLSDRRGLVSTGATANSTAILYFHAQEHLGWSPGKDYRVLDWSKALGFSVMMTQTTRAANGKGRIYLGADDATTAQDPTTKAIGFCIENGDVKGWCHDGTTLTAVNLAVTLTLLETTYLTVVSDGTGNVEWFVNGVSKGTSALGPTGDSSSTMNSFQFSITNGASASDCDLWLHSLEGVIKI